MRDKRTPKDVCGEARHFHFERFFSIVFCMQLKTCGSLYLINESIPDSSTVINGREQREVHSHELLLSKNEFPSTGTGPQSLSHSPQSTVHFYLQYTLWY